MLSLQFFFFAVMLNTVGTFISWAKSDLLLLYNASEAQQMIFLLLEEVKGFSRTDVNLKLNEELTKEEWERLAGYQEELMLGKPIQYVLKQAWFCGMKFRVNEHVLIPRPETEELVEWVSAQLPKTTSDYSILDIGTGNGCIAIALKKKFPHADVHALDISPDALKVARENAAMNHAEITFYEGDILSRDFQHTFDLKFDVIVSNPPYIRKKEMQSMSSHVINHEPLLALFVDDKDALVFYKAIADFSLLRLNQNGKLFFEINQELGAKVKSLLEEKGFRNVELKKDLSGNERMVIAHQSTNPLIN